ncbi:MAG: YciI family protein [Planctomycetota bacterium]
MLLVYSNEQSWTPEEWTACTVESAGICRELAAQGLFEGASPLHPVATAVTVRVREGERLVTTGPFAETAEQLGGYYILELPSLEDAIEVASRLPPAKKGTVEIRPLFELEGLPPDREEKADGGDKKVMLICYDDEDAWNDAGEVALRGAMQEAVELAHEVDAAGKYLTASPLQASSTAKCVRLRDGKRLVTDGPFAETHEVLGGYYLLQVNAIEEAVEIAARHPGVGVGSVEVREVFKIPDLPTRNP